MRSLIWMVLLSLCFLGAQGCSCQAVGLNIPEQSNSNTNSGNNKDNPPTSTKTVEDVTDKPGTFGVQGVAALTFYPKVTSGSEGGFGGYVLFYDQPQETNVQFASMKNGECKFKEYKGSSDTTIPYKGMDAGEELVLSFASQEWQWMRNPFRYYNKEYGVYYLGPSVEKLNYPYEGDVTLSSKGGGDIKDFNLKWKAPARLDISQPAISFAEPILVERDKGLPMSWKFVGEAPYLAVRINQSNPDGKGGRTVTCRYSATGPATLPAEELKKFQTDATGERSHIFFFAGRYLLAKIPSLSKPLFVVMESITTSSVQFK